MEFALEPKSVTPSNPQLALSICGFMPTGFLQIRIHTIGTIKYHASVPVGMFADGGVHEIAVSISRKKQEITYYLDQKIMSTTSYVYDEIPMPMFATGKILVGAFPNGNQPSFIGRMRNAYIETDERLPYKDKYKVVGFNERGYGSCIGYSYHLADQGVCKDFNEPNDPIFMPPQRFTVVIKALLDGFDVIANFVSKPCRDVLMKYACGSLIMPCATYEHGGRQYSFPRSPCRSQCEAFIAECSDDLIAIENIIHAVPVMRFYTAEAYKTFCNLTVDGHCNGRPDAPRCRGEQLRISSPASYVDIFQRQQAHPVEGSSLPDGGIIPCATNNASYEVSPDCPEGFARYIGLATEKKCVFPCVSFLYTWEQIDSQFSAYIITGLIGMVANFSLIALDATSRIYEWIQKRRGKREKGWSTLPTFVVLCAVLGLLFGLIDTIPAAILKFDLPCSEDCIHEFCHGDGLACKVAQPSEYLLLLVFCILLGVLIELYMKAVINSPAPRIRHVKRCYSMTVFVTMLVVVLACVFADSDVLATGSDEYRQLILSRDIFSCGPRYSSSVQELVFLTLPFMFVCFALVGFTFGMIHSIWVMMTKVPDSSVSGSLGKFGKVAGKLMALALVVFTLWLVRASIAGAQQPIITSFSMDANKYLDCQLLKGMTRSITLKQQVCCCCCCCVKGWRCVNRHENIPL
jgi:hypothetical protein